MRALPATIMITLLLPLLAGCGQMGPLYMPEKAPPPATQPEPATADPTQGNS